MVSLHCFNNLLRNTKLLEYAAADLDMGALHLVVERLPADMRPGKFRDASEVTAYAFSVALHRLKGGGAEIAEQVQVIATFFMSAATRLTQIMTTRPGESRKP